SRTLGELPGDGAACWVAGEEAVGARSLGVSSRPQAARKHSTRTIPMSTPRLCRMTVPQHRNRTALLQRGLVLHSGSFPAKLGTAYCNWPRQFGGTISRAQHPRAALGASAVATLAQCGGSGKPCAPLRLY